MDIYRSILVHFLFTDWSVYLYTRSAVSLENMTETFFITIWTQEFRQKRSSSRRRQIFRGKARHRCDYLAGV